MGWLDFDRALWAQLRDEARRNVLRSLPAPISGSDVRRDAVAFAEQNARAAGVGNLLTFRRQDVRDFRPPEGPPGVLICNPPYGERIGEVKELRQLYADLGRAVRERCAGWACFVFSGNDDLVPELGLTVASRKPFFNGRIPCHLLRVTA
jgi:putative N6-adenine-specific DNA methylase